MATLKELLGEKYKDGMTLGEVEEALNGKNLADLATGDYVSKAKYTTLEQRAKDTEKRLNDKLTEDEKATKDALDREAYYKTLEKENAVYKYTAKISQSIADNEVVAKIATCYANGEIDKAIEMQNDYYKKYNSEMEKSIKEKLLKDFPQPAAQTTNKGKSFAEMTLDERAELKRTDPEKYKTLKNQN